MKKSICLLLVLALCLPLCACGSAAIPTEPPTEPPTEAPTEPPREPVPDIVVFVLTPEDWQNVELRAWKDGKPDEQKVVAVDFSCEIPGWANRIKLSCNGGAIETDELVIEPLVPNVPVEVHVVNEGYVFVHNEGPVDGTQLRLEQEQAAVDYHNSIQAVFEKGNYQVTAAKAVAFDERYGNYSEKTNRYCKDYVPTNLLAETPEEIYYVIHIYDANEYFTYVDWQGKNEITAIKPGIQFEIREIGTGKVLAKSEPIMGGDPPQVISEGQSARGSEPKEEEINAWIECAFEELLSNPPKELPMIP